MRIAVCDDCREDALLLKEYLAGHEVSVYSNAESLLTDVEGNNKQFDLYLLDIFMEESMNGIELAERLRRGRKKPCSVLFPPAMTFTGRRMTSMPSST